MIYDRIEYDVLNRVYRQYVPSTDLSIAVGGGTAIRDATGLCSGHRPV
jgi:hypothetical protein